MSEGSSEMLFRVGFSSPMMSSIVSKLHVVVFYPSRNGLVRKETKRKETI